MTYFLPTVGQKIGSYQVERVESLPEMSASLILLRHACGAQHIHIARDDDNCAFAVTFPTIPTDSTGVAHILEHNVLMGSRKYPVPAPFFSMLPRSLHTFMNAMTASDWTTYPYSTRNRKDYFNLLSIYLDATFFPLLRPESFRQDGHRFEFETPNDPSTPLKLQGVVYNEMKGAMASAGSVLWRGISAALYPDLTYAHHSGGEPEAIPNLTYEELKQFHRVHYHPSAAYFYTYGNQDLIEVLDVIQRDVMDHFTPQQTDFTIPDQPNFDTPQRKELIYASNDTERGAQVVLAWKLADRDPDAMLRWSILSDILLGNAGAPLYQPLIESHLGMALADVGGYLTSFREPAFAVGLKGTSIDREQDIERLILETLQHIADTGIAPELIEASLHQFEMAQREVSNAGSPYALTVFFRLLRPWLNNEDPLNGLSIDAQIQNLRDDLQKGPVFEQLIRELLATNHRVTVVLKPDQAWGEMVQELEQELIKQLSSHFTTEDHERIIRESLALKEQQNAPVDLSVLPTLTLDDIPKTVPRPEYHTEEWRSGTIARAPQPTGGLVYLHLRVYLPSLPQHLFELLPIFAYAVTRSGAAGLDYAAMARRIDRIGAIGASVEVHDALDHLNHVRVSFNLGGKALAKDGDKLVTLLRDVLTEPLFEPERLQQLIEQRISGLKASIVRSGNSYAASVARAQISSSAAIDEAFSGLSLMKTLQEKVNDPALPQQLLELGQWILKGRLAMCLTAKPEDLSLDLSSLDLFEGAEVVDQSFAVIPHTPHAYLTETPVSFNALSYPTVPYTHADSPALLVLAHLLRTQYLLPEIREKGGAYGAGASFHPRSGTFTFSSYRDPQITQTYQVFKEAADWLTQHDEPALTEAILSASAALDPLTSPDTAPRLRFLSDQAGLTPDVQETYKERLLAVTVDDLQRVAKKYCLVEQAAYGIVTGSDPSSQTALDWTVQRL